MNRICHSIQIKRYTKGTSNRGTYLLINKDWIGLKANWVKNWIYIKALRPVFLTLIYIVLALDNLQNIIMCNKGCFSKNGSASKLWKALNPKRKKLRNWNFTNLFIWSDKQIGEMLAFSFSSFVFRAFQSFEAEPFLLKHPLIGNQLGILNWRWRIWD